MCVCVCGCLVSGVSAVVFCCSVTHHEGGSRCVCVCVDTEWRSLQAGSSPLRAGRSDSLANQMPFSAKIAAHREQVDTLSKSGELSLSVSACSSFSL